MDFSLIHSLYKNRTASRGTTELLRYFIKLKIGEFTGTIYKSSNKKSNELYINFLIEGEKTLDRYIRKFLANYSTDGIIDVEKKKGLQNIGTGCLVVPNVLEKLIILTQKVASFYFRTDQSKDYNFKIDLVSIPKVSGSIKIEEQIITSFNMGTLGKKTVEIIINQKMIKEKISKISIHIDKCWFPNYLDLNIADFPLGVGITKMSCK